MSAFDPLAAVVADAALAQSAVAAIDLGVQVEILQQQLSVGDLLTATILPPQSGSDRLSLLGHTVLAQLPPGIDPGESLLLQVTGFQGNQILVRNLGVVDPNNPPPTVNVALPQPAPGTAAQATLTRVQQPPQSPASSSVPLPQTPAPAQPSPPQTVPQAAPQTVPPPVAPPPVAPPPVAPPRAVFVAASVLPAQPLPVEAHAAPTPIAPQTVVPTEELGLEARIAATRAASIDLADLVNQTQPAAPQAPPPRSPQAPPVSPPITPPPIVSRTVSSTHVPPAAQATSAPVPQAAPAPRASIAPELALLARLRIPALPFTLAAARLANIGASILPKTLARLDALLAQLPQIDARVATVRTIAAFLGKLDLGNTRALPEQLMAYVSNVVDGSESKLAAIVRTLNALTGEDQPPPAATPAAPSANSPVIASAGAKASDASQNTARPAAEGQLQTSAVSAADQPAIAAHAAERAVALQYDLKAAIVSMTDSPPHNASPQLVAALGEALTTISAVQLNVANAQSTDPNAIVVPLPVFYYEGGRPAQLRISRDAPQGGKKLDADNFHIAFVLDTKSLGTVAVDVQTASRSVSVNVKTEVPAAASRFRETFDDLRSRLEQLHYRVANVAASVAPHLAAPVVPSKANDASDVEAQDRSSNLDLQA